MIGKPIKETLASFCSPLIWRKVAGLEHSLFPVLCTSNTNPTQALTDSANVDPENMFLFTFPLSFPLSLISLCFSPQVASVDFSNVRSLVECGLFPQALEDIQASLHPGVLPPASILHACMQHALQVCMPTFTCPKPIAD